MNPIQKLNELRQYGGARRTVGLDDATIERFAASHPELAEAIDAAHAAHLALRNGEFEDLLRADEQTQINETQAGFVNFYADDAVNPYVALTARGPWIVTLKGAVIHDSGGYGMLGMGHAPKVVLEAMAKPQAMANIMTPSLSHLRLTRALRREIGQSRGGCPYTHFLCLNSGSESVTLAGRIADINTKLHTDAGGRHAGKKVKRIAVKGAFHGRTEHPALYSDSTRKTYAQHLASHKHHEAQLIIIEPYSVEQLRQAFADADANGWYVEAMFLEPVMGEGDPGRQVTAEFYAAARELTRDHGTLLLVDSIQAGLRAHGVLSIVDYPGFEGLEAPDMETYSKALNAGQYPLSVLAVNERAAKLYRKGVYGNTMTANPRALDVACVVLDQLTPALRQNIRSKGKLFVERLEQLKQELGGLITKVQGTGLLFSCELSADFKCYGEGSTEEFLRERGIGVIHGGANSLRFTPTFAITDAEVDLLVGAVRQALLEGPRKAESKAA
ncbi:aminotransferase class III-fold pyridoxal phosphate-dependent enzyme [Pseudomarimonas salicorniae]|uniref:Aminotransferase class III-fold pyridoxal phosphate-dependent enzyme n=1 Tax=Pseudomarimonas salicorniae TaxID=2933270 RepID=A0ABT0GGN3_9GAMM|nr:aminotransferase class III-fold pyridoxal phosphate-dependent enzyme [Lysobacter sp. CAU 1642]MCK7593691.1 aminotransferase class III-fold pyridoxal phosphate-dependent enzyme [Lysobacter sp. CAU 1642]